LRLEVLQQLPAWQSPSVVQQPSWQAPALQHRPAPHCWSFWQVQAVHVRLALSQH